MFTTQAKKFINLIKAGLSKTSNKTKVILTLNLCFSFNKKIFKSIKNIEYFLRFVCFNVLVYIDIIQSILVKP